MNLTPHLGLIEILVYSVLPVIVALVTSRFASSGVKTAVLLFLTAVTALLTSVITNDGIVAQQAVSDFVAGTGWAIIAYFGVLKPTNLAGENSVAANSGLQLGA